MYRVKSDGAIVGYSDTVYFIRLHENGCYVPAEKEQAGGFCVKQVVSQINEEGTTETRLVDTVYQFEENSLKGAEPIGEVEEVNGAMLLANTAEYEQALSVLGVEV